MINNSHIPNCNENCLNQIDDYVFANHSQKEGLQSRILKLVYFFRYIYYRFIFFWEGKGEDLQLPSE